MKTERIEVPAPPPPFRPVEITLEDMNEVKAVFTCLEERGGHESYNSICPICVLKKFLREVIDKRG